MYAYKMVKPKEREREEKEEQGSDTKHEERIQSKRNRNRAVALQLHVAVMYNTEVIGLSAAIIVRAMCTRTPSLHLQQVMALLVPTVPWGICVLFSKAFLPLKGEGAKDPVRAFIRSPHVLFPVSAHRSMLRV